MALFVHILHIIRIHLDKILTGYYSAHCYFSRLNLKKMGPLQFCLSIFLGIRRNPKQIDFFKIPVRDS